MGKTTTVKYEITPEIKELQKLALAIKPIGYEVNVDITQDLVTINGFRKLTREEAKIYIKDILANAKNSLTTKDFPDPEVVAREQRAAEKKARKHREPGTPPSDQVIFRRAKRIYKKSMAKLGDHSKSLAKATEYITKRQPEYEPQQVILIGFESWRQKQTKLS